MKLKNSILAIATAAAAMAATAASAITVNTQGSTANTVVSTVGAGTKILDVTFTWTGAGAGSNAASAFVDFTAGHIKSVTAINYETYLPGTTTPIGNVSFYTFDADATRLTTDYNNCTNPNALAEVQGTCDRIASSQGIPNFLLGPVSGSSFTLGLFESGAANDGTLTIRISAVPLPAAGLMLAGAIGAVGVRARRKAKKAA